jgi:hypothetical protein
MLHIYNYKIRTDMCFRIICLQIVVHRFKNWTSLSLCSGERKETRTLIQLLRLAISMGPDIVCLLPLT